MSLPTSVRVFAPAKINLTLHVTGQRDDGYHMLDSLVAFADVGDELLISTARGESLEIQGSEASGVPATTDNLILKVMSLIEDLAGAHTVLTKNLPVASGIGGGSADAAAAYRAVTALHNGTSDTSLHLLLDDPDAVTRLLQLGADIPMCLLSRCARVSGIGEQIEPIETLPKVQAVLVNPRVQVPTPSVFNAMETRDNPAMPEKLPRFSDAGDFIDWLTFQRNDLEEAAQRLEPSISAVKLALARDPACRLARMSGSGATCFGLYETQKAARAAAEGLRQRHPTWWVSETELGTQTNAAMPRIT